MKTINSENLVLAAMRELIEKGMPVIEFDEYKPGKYCFFYSRKLTREEKKTETDVLKKHLSGVAELAK